MLEGSKTFSKFPLGKPLIFPISEKHKDLAKFRAAKERRAGRFGQIWR
jgi:hypothetical protein